MDRIKVYSSFAELPPRFALLFEQAAHSSLFFSLPWFVNYAQVCSRECRLRIYTLETSQSNPLAVLPMQHTPAGRFAPRHLKGMQNYYTSLFGLITAADMQHAARALASALADERWDTVDMHPLETDAGFELWRQAFSAAGMPAKAYFCFGNWYLEVGGRTFAQYAQTLPSKLRNTLKRKSKNLAAQDFRMDIVSGGEMLDGAIAAYQRIYQASWKKPEPYADFMPGLMRTCAEQGWLRLGLMHIGGEPAAAQLWIVCNGVASIYKLAYDQRFDKFSPGSLLTAHLMEHVIDVDKVREVDYLTGDDAYKKDWMSHRRERWGIVAFNPRTPLGLLALSRHLGGRAIKTVMSFLPGKPHA